MYFELLYTGITRAESLDSVIINKFKPTSVEGYTFRTDCVAIDPFKNKVDGVVYGLINKKREVIYVGSTDDTDRRLEEHRTTQAWAGEIHEMIVFEHFPCNKMEDLRAREYDYLQYYVDRGNRCVCVCVRTPAGRQADRLTDRHNT